MKEALVKKIEEIIGKDGILLNEPMSKHTTFKVGGACDCLILPNTKEELIGVLELLTKEKEDYFLLGNGSNILVREKGIRKIVVCTNNLKEIKVNGNEISALAGNLLSEISKVALTQELTGLEFSSGIPGSLGGAIYMNAGAYGKETKDILKSATLWDKEKGVITLSNEELKFAYRKSILQENNMVVLEGVYSLQKGNHDEIKEEMSSLNKKRRDKQPLEYPSAGSTFKRPSGYFAGKLIEDAGLRGYKIGGAMVSSKHCGFVVNEGNATSKDVLELIAFVQKEVYNKFNVSLETEVKIIGEE